MSEPRPTSIAELAEQMTAEYAERYSEAVALAGRCIAGLEEEILESLSRHVPRLQSGGTYEFRLPNRPDRWAERKVVFDSATGCFVYEGHQTISANEATYIRMELNPGDPSENVLKLSVLPLAGIREPYEKNDEYPSAKIGADGLRGRTIMTSDQLESLLERTVGRFEQSAA